MVLLARRPRSFMRCALAPGAPGAPAPARPSLAASALLAIPALATVACLAGAVRFLIWTRTRGLDITDEGFYFLMSRYPGDVTMSTTAYHLLLRPLFRLVNWNIP